MKVMVCTYYQNIALTHSSNEKVKTSPIKETIHFHVGYSAKARRRSSCSQYIHVQTPLTFHVDNVFNVVYKTACALANSR